MDTIEIFNCFCCSMDWYLTFCIWMHLKPRRLISHPSLQLQIHRHTGLISRDERLLACLVFSQTLDDVHHIWSSVRIRASNDFQFVKFSNSAVLFQMALPVCWHCSIGSSDRHIRNDSAHTSSVKCSWLAMDS